MLVENEVRQWGSARLNHWWSLVPRICVSFFTKKRNQKCHDMKQEKCALIKIYSPPFTRYQEHVRSEILWRNPWKSASNLPVLSRRGVYLHVAISGQATRIYYPKAKEENFRHLICIVLVTVYNFVLEPGIFFIEFSSLWGESIGSTWEVGSIRGHA